MGLQWPDVGSGALNTIVHAQVLFKEATNTFIAPTIGPPDLTQLGKHTLRRHKENLVHTRTQETGAVTPQEIDPDLPVSVQESLVEAWVDGGLLQDWGH